MIKPKSLIQLYGKLASVKCTTQLDSSGDELVLETLWNEDITVNIAKDVWEGFDILTYSKKR